MLPNKSFLSLAAPKRGNLSGLFERAAKWFFVISYLAGFPWKVIDPTTGQEAMGLFGIVGIFCWVFHLAYRTRRP